jgi:hypothetical protein
MELEEGGRGVGGGSKYQTEIPKVRLGKFNVAMTRVSLFLEVEIRKVPNQRGNVDVMCSSGGIEDVIFEGPIDGCRSGPNGL